MHERFDALYAATEAALIEQAGRASSGELAPSAFGEAMAARLEEAHTEAVVIGRSHAGDDWETDDDDRAFGARVVDEEAEYLSRFVADLFEGRYVDEEGSVNAEGIARRAAMYAGRLVGTANEAWRLSLSDTTLLYWHLGEVETSHCSDCPELALHSPYRPETLPTVPGANETSCLMNCRCWLTTGSGQTGFSLPEG